MAQWYKNVLWLKDRRRSLRTHQTKAEEVLWQELRAKRTGHKFYRQFSLGKKYIVDFYCEKFKLIIELDGPIHDDPDQKMHDEIRQKWLEDQGYNVVRFKNDEVLFQREKVMMKIKELCNDARPLSVSPLTGERTY